MLKNFTNKNQNKDPNHFFDKMSQNQHRNSEQLSHVNEQIKAVTDKFQSKVNFLENEIENLLEIMYEKGKNFLIYYLNR